MRAEGVGTWICRKECLAGVAHSRVWRLDVVVQPRQHHAPLYDQTELDFLIDPARRLRLMRRVSAAATQPYSKVTEPPIGAPLLHARVPAAEREHCQDDEYRYSTGTMLPQPGGWLKGKWLRSGDWDISLASP